MDRPPKISNLMDTIQKCIASGRYFDTTHVIQRQSERDITRPEMLQALTNGFHEKRKDTFDEAYGSWNYAVRGKTIDARKLRIIVSFDDSNMLIITAIALDSFRRT